MTMLRIRQLVFASHERSDIQVLRTVLGLGEAFVDPGVDVFGLTNGVFALGDQFLETVVPVKDNTAAGRFLDRSSGEGGYMAIFQTDDLDAVRARADAQKIRRVWNIDLPEISASHLHPGDIGAAIVSVDEARPEGSWLWGGPDWTAQTTPGGICGLDVAATDPQAMSATWGTVLGALAQAIGHDVFEISTADGPIRFLPDSRDHLSSYTLRHPDPEACLKRAQEQGLSHDQQAFDYAGVRIQLKAD